MHSHDFATYDPVMAEFACSCGARVTKAERFAGMPKTQKPTEPAPDRCMHCGHPKTEHVPVSEEDHIHHASELICPTSLFLLDTFQADLEGA